MGFAIGAALGPKTQVHPGIDRQLDDLFALLCPVKMVVDVVSDLSTLRDAHLLALERDTLLLEKHLDLLFAIHEELNVDVTPFANVARAHRADEPRLEGLEQTQSLQGSHAHGEQPPTSTGPFTGLGQRQQGVPYLPVGGQIHGAVADVSSALQAAEDPLGRHPFGGEVLLHFLLVHQARRLIGNDRPNPTDALHAHGVSGLTPFK
jgi:hypothetical protein